jgi:hypothetical protein
MADTRTRSEYKLIAATFSSNENQLTEFEDAVTECLNNGFELRGAPFIYGNRIYQPMTKESRGTGFTGASAFGSGTGVKTSP